jgi:hypothetical protein
MGYDGCHYTTGGIVGQPLELIGNGFHSNFLANLESEASRFFSPPPYPTAPALKIPRAKVVQAKK